MLRIKATSEAVLPPFQFERDSSSHCHRSITPVFIADKLFEPQQNFNSLLIRKSFFSIRTPFWENRENRSANKKWVATWIMNCLKFLQVERRRVTRYLPLYSFNDTVSYYSLRIPPPISKGSLINKIQCISVNWVAQFHSNRHHFSICKKIQIIFPISDRRNQYSISTVSTKNKRFYEQTEINKCLFRCRKQNFGQVRLH